MIGVSSCVLCCADVQQEKQHQSLLQGVENFDPKILKQTHTNEKTVLPTAEGSQPFYLWIQSVSF